jgi:DNA-directed RNA polymerase subunit RPC12/RpoP
MSEQTPQQTPWGRGPVWPPKRDGDAPAAAPATAPAEQPAATPAPTPPPQQTGEVGPDGERKFPCAQCGALLKFNPGAASLTCEYCGHVNPIARDTSAIAELDFRAALAATRQSQATQEVAGLKCDSCGAEFTPDAKAEASACPFCGSSVVHQAPRAEQLKPKGVLPFKITKDDAQARFREWLKGLWFAPNKLKEFARADRSGLAGMYTPYWTYDAATTSQYVGERGVNRTTYRTVTVTVNGRPETRTEPVTVTDWYPAAGTVRRNFDDVLVLASDSLPRKYTDRLAPWDMQSLAPYNESYLAGFRAERYQVGLEAGFERAREVMAPQIVQDCKANIGGDHQRVHSVNTSYGAITYKHILLPIWLAAYQFRGKTFRFVINGRSGAVQGERPYSPAKIALAVGGVILAIIIIGLLVAGGDGGGAGFRK